ncbi:TPA: hypothetical protein G8S59_004002 [Salmonella enterica]|uniref:Invasin domain-containing protein n=1 Tax=Salmonella enterica TaxID=28901 RepID=A0A756YCW4_SALER|nr:hypothetical protein [Salmonella enterica]
MSNLNIIWRFFLMFILINVNLSSFTLGAIVENITNPVKGHKPTLLVDIHPSEVYIGDIITINKSFSDVDNDPEINGGSPIEWKIEDVPGSSDFVTVNGYSSFTYKTQVADAGKKIFAILTPKTDPLTTDPYEGDLVSTPPVLIFGEIDGSSSSISSNKSSIEADGKDVAKIKLLLKDKYGNAINIDPKRLTLFITASHTSNDASVSPIIKGSGRGEYESTITAGIVQQLITVSLLLDGNNTPLSINLDVVKPEPLPAPGDSEIIINGVSAMYSSGINFSSGFYKAKFEVHLPKTLSDSDFNWSVSSSFLTIDSKNEIRFINKPSGNGIFFINAEPKRLGQRGYVFKFSQPKYWYVFTGKTATSRAEAIQVCNNLGLKLPNEENLTKYSNSAQSFVRDLTSVAIWNFWGDLSAYGIDTDYAYWTLNGGSEGVNLINGNRDLTLDSWDSNVVCY